MPVPDIYQFGSFELNAATGELRKHGLRLKLQDQPSKILVLLIRHAGESVTREDIQRELWPADVHVDFENAINSAVRKLRDCLGDSADQPRFIETLARRGYRFIAPVIATGAPMPQAASSPTPQAIAPRPRITPIRIIWAGIALAAAGIGLAFLIMRPAAHREAAQLTPVPLTTSPGVECCPSFSPDGSRIAFSWNGPNQDNFDIYVKQVGAGEPVRMTRDAAQETFPAWSPDGKSIAFLRQLDNRQAAIILIPSLGPGREREVVRTKFDWRGIDWSLPGPLLAWASDSRHLFTTEVLGANGRYGMIRVSADTGEKHGVTDPPGPPGDGSIVVSPDGRTLAFTRVVSIQSSNDIYTVPLSKDALPTGKPERLTSDSRFISGLAWADGGRELAFSSDRSRRWELWRIALPGSKEAERVMVLGNVDAMQTALQVYLAISPQARRLAYVQPHLSARSIGRIRLPAGEDKPRRLISSTRSDFNPQYSPDGTRIAFESGRSGRGEIFICNADGSSPNQLTSFDKGFSGSPSWSPDGRTIAFDSSNAGNWDIYSVSSNGGKAVAVTNHPSDDFAPSWSRDGKWIYFASKRTGRNEIWKTPGSGGGEVPVTRNGGFSASESTDGRHLYYTKTMYDSALWEMETGGSVERKVVESITARHFAVTRRGIYFVSGEKSERALRYFDLGSRGITTIARVEQSAGNGLTVSPDERFLLFNVPGVMGSELMLVENFR